jgi:hypothetical protein
MGEVMDIVGVGVGICIEGEALGMGIFVPARS